MKEDSYTAGQVIYREGGPGDAIFIIKEGEVAVLRDVSGEEVRLAVLRKGAIFGETGVLHDRPRSTTTRALGNITRVTISKETFLSTFRKDNPLALPLLRMLCERLSQADSRLVEQRIYSEGARLIEVASIRLLPASTEMRGQIGGEGMVIADLPFRVGRHALPGEKPDSVLAELMLRIPISGQLSPRQFAIEEITGRLVLRDLQSHLGTLVNGVRIASFEQSDTADLTFGENEIQAGGLESPYRFRVIEERKTGQSTIRSDLK